MVILNQVRQNKEYTIKKAKINFEFSHNHPEWSNDKDVVLAAIQQDWWAFQYASGGLRKK